METTMSNNKPKKIPYGKMNWEEVRLKNYYYVDKTRFIPEIEAANDYFFFDGVSILCYHHWT